MVTDDKVPKSAEDWYNNIQPIGYKMDRVIKIDGRSVGMIFQSTINPKRQYYNPLTRDEVLRYNIDLNKVAEIIKNQETQYITPFE